MSSNVESMSSNVESNQVDIPEIVIDPSEVEKIERNSTLQNLYYRPEGYYQSSKKLLDALIEHSNFQPNINEKKELMKNVKEWLEKQAIWQIHSPAPNYIPRASFNQITCPNTYHQADILYLPHDKVNRNIYKYCLTIVDVASRYKQAVPLIDRSSVTTAKAFRKIYNDKRCPLTWPKVLMVDDGSEFKQKVSKMMMEKNVRIKIGNSKRSQAIVERFNRTLAERLFRIQDAREMVTETIDRAWVKNLPIVIDKLNSEITRLIGMAPAEAIKKDSVDALPSKLHKNRKIGNVEERLPINVFVRYLLDDSDRESKRRATDNIWSNDIFTIEYSLVNNEQPVLYKLTGDNAPDRLFVREELLVIPNDTELPPSNILS